MDRNLPSTDALTEQDWETAEYVYRYFNPCSDGDRCHPRVLETALIIAKIRLRHEGRRG